MIDEKEKLKLEIEKLKLENENLKLSKNIKENIKAETAEDRNKRIAEAEKKLKSDIENIKSDSYVPQNKTKEIKPLTAEDIKEAVYQGNVKTRENLEYDNTLFYIVGFIILGTIITVWVNG